MNTLSMDAMPARLKNLNTGEDKPMFINPEDFDLGMVAEYSQRNILGMGNSPMDYNKGKNPAISFSVYTSASHIQTKGRVSRDRALFEMTEWRNFLASLIFPINKRQSGGVTGEPPRTWFHWPKTLSMSGRILSITWKFKMFQLSGEPILEVAKVQFVADLGTAFWSEDMRITGLETGQ